MQVFVAINRFRIAEGKEIDFEQRCARYLAFHHMPVHIAIVHLALTFLRQHRWANRESELQQMPGFKAFVMCRRDGMKADDGFNYQSTTVWQDRLSFENWTQSQQFASAHKDAKQGVRCTSMPALSAVPEARASV